MKSLFESPFSDIVMLVLIDGKLSKFVYHQITVTWQRHGRTRKGWKQCANYDLKSLLKVTNSCFPARFKKGLLLTKNVST